LLFLEIYQSKLLNVLQWSNSLARFCQVKERTQKYAIIWACKIPIFMPDIVIPPK
jgi:hypothetical protein